MTKRVKVLTDDDPPPWSSIRPPSHRVSNPIRYVRGELGHFMCRQYPADDCVVCPCPVDDGDVDEHAVTICRRGDCDNVAISCSEGHSSEQVLEAILEEL